MITSGDAVANAIAPAGAPAGGGVRAGTAPAPQIRPLSPADRARVEATVRATGLFKEEEVAVALEVFDDACAGGRTTGGAASGPAHSPPAAPPVVLPPAYTGAGATVENDLAGWIIWGPTPCTAGTYDMYWLVVDPKYQSQGIGTALVREMERRLAGAARLIVVETAGRPDYAGTRAFYEARGYRRAATIPDFYAPDDDLVVYTKSLTTLAR